MKNYKVIYAFEVINNIRDGKLVGLTDRGEGVVHCVNDMNVNELADVLNQFDGANGRYEFWIEEEVGEENE